MKKSYLSLILCLLIQLGSISAQITDSINISISEARNIVKSNERLKDCQILVAELDSQNVRLEKVIDSQDNKITDLYNIQNLHKDNFNLKSEELESCQSETKILKKEIRRQKFQKFLIIAGAMVVQGVTIYLFTHPF